MKQLLLYLCTAIAVTSQAQTSNALNLNGTGQYVSVPDNDALDISSSITIELWVYLNSISSGQEQELVDKASNEATNYRFDLTNPNGVNGNTQLGFWNGSTAAVFSTAKISNAVWTHIAVTISGGTLSFYINGVLSNTAPYTVGTPNTAPLTIGKHTVFTDRNFNGRLDDIRIWNVARTPIQLKANMYQPPTIHSPGLVAYYKCDDAGTTLTNAAYATGTAINGSMPAGGSFVASPIRYAGNALSLDRAAGSHVSIGSPLPSNSSYTKEAWVYVTNPNVPNNILSSNSSPFWISPGLMAGNNGSNATVQEGAGVTFPTNVWTHAAVTYDAATSMFRLYKNGVLVAGPTASAQQYVAQNHYIGAWYNGSATESYLGGMVDDVRLWNVARTQTQIANNMNAELMPYNEPTLVSYYTFNQGTASGTNTGITFVPDNKGNFNGTMVNINLTGSASNFVAQKSGFTILPVTWLSFTAQEYQQQVLLKWSTAAEQGNNSFTVQHSTDGTNYTDLGTVPSAGNSTATQQYRYTHSSPAAGINYYRIRQQDHGGAVSYSSINTVRIVERENDFAVQNTVVQNGRLQVQVFKPVTLKIISHSGALLYKKQLNKGNHTIDLSNVSKGAGFVSSDEQVVKIIMQ